jgi:hypothetical protein
MTKYLRQSIFDDKGVAITQVVAEGSLHDDIHICANGMREAGYPPQIDIEIFEHEGETLAASIEGQKRAQDRIPDRKRHMDTLHDWLIAAFKLVVEKGVIGAPHPAPLKAEDIMEVIGDVIKRTDYKSQRIVILAEDGKSVVQAVDGKILKLEKL